MMADHVWLAFRYEPTVTLKSRFDQLLLKERIGNSDFVTEIKESVRVRNSRIPTYSMVNAADSLISST